MTTPLFQSRSGFSVRRDGGADSVGPATRRGFNPGLGFRSVVTREFSKLQRGNICFNPGLGFRSVVTSTALTRTPKRFWFQSRSGFSVRRDPSPAPGVHNRKTSFNPGLGFRSVVTTTCSPATSCGSAFQSRSGFSVRRDPAAIVADPSVS